MSIHRRVSRAAFVVGVAVVAAACNGSGDAAGTTSTAAPTTTTTVPPTTTTSTTTTTTTSTTTTSTSTTTTTLPQIFRQPLTGLPIGSAAEIVNRPALAVKIDNAPAARRNHTGLAVADIVFEELVGSQISRFVAIFHSTGSNPVGPIRSGRQQDVDMIGSFNAPLFAWSGGNRGVTQLIRESPFLVDLNAAHARGYYRGPGGSPNNLYNDTETLWAQTPPDHPGPPPQQFDYLRPEERFEGQPIAGVDLDVGQIDIQWDWDAGSGRWLRSQEGGPHIDKTHGRIGATNVIVMVVVYVPSTIDARNPRALTVDSGPVFVFSDGQVIEGRWERGNLLVPISLFDRDGAPIALNSGNTWIELPDGHGSKDVDNPGITLNYIPAP